jgi:iron complex transport system substrate-binding protein
MKIVSLLPSATEIVFALGLGDQLEGVTYECDYPAEARSKPVISDTALPQDRPLTPGEIDGLVRDYMRRQEPIYVLDKDLIQKIQPDLILAQDLCRVCAVPSGQVEQALDELGCRSEVLSLDPHSLDEVLDGIDQVGRATGTSEAATTLTGELRDRIERVRRAASGLPRVRTLALEWSDPPWVGGHWVPEMVQIAGGVNLLNEAGQPSRTVSWTDIGDAAPEVIVFMPCGMYLPEAEDEGARLLAIPDLADTAAARLGTVFAVDASSYFSRPGPRLVDGLEILAWAIHPEAFARPPSNAISRVGSVR